ncbi:MAG: trans-acting enoyl reductase family protein [Sandaracinaceae bacterium]
MSERDLDVVLFGATGFTGGLAADHLAAHAPPGLRWAIAGRNADKLAKVGERLGMPGPTQLIADASDPASLLALTKRARVVATTVGPFELHGEPLVKACVEGGASYVDTTGEMQFVNRMIERYHEAAASAHVKIIPCCAFEAIPPDLGALYTLDRLPHGGPVTIEAFVKASATFSGGTWQTAVKGMSEARSYQRERRGKRGRAPSGGRSVRGVKARIRFRREIGAWAVPMPTIDPQVVLRSAELLDEYGPEFRYGHYMRLRTFPSVAKIVGGAAGVFALAQLGPTRRLLEKVKPAGEGPDEATRARSWFTITFLGRAGTHEVMTEVSGGDPGYTETSRMLAESAVMLAKHADETPERYGVITPAVGLGRAMIERLQTIGIAFRTLPTSHDPA